MRSHRADSIEKSRLVVEDQRLRPLEKKAIYASPQEAKRVVNGLAERYAAGWGPVA